MHACTQAAGQWSPPTCQQPATAVHMHAWKTEAHSKVLRTLFPAAWEACEHANALTPPAAGAHCVKQQCVHQLTRVHCTKLT